MWHGCGLRQHFSLQFQIVDASQALNLLTLSHLLSINILSMVVIGCIHKKKRLFTLTISFYITGHGLCCHFSLNNRGKGRNQFWKMLALQLKMICLCSSERKSDFSLILRHSPVSLLVSITLWYSTVLLEIRNVTCCHENIFFLAERVLLYF